MGNAWDACMDAQKNKEEVNECPLYYIAHRNSRNSQCAGPPPMCVAFSSRPAEQNPSRAFRKVTRPLLNETFRWQNANKIIHSPVAGPGPAAVSGAQAPDCA